MRRDHQLRHAHDHDPAHRRDHSHGHAHAHALRSGQIAAAGLDVFEGEPHLNPRFLALPNVLLQPHHASGTVETRRAMGQMMRDNLTAHFAGQPLLTPVNLEQAKGPSR